MWKLNRTANPGAFFVLFAGLTLSACGDGEMETRTFRLQSLDASQAEELIRPYVFEEREGAPGELSVSASSLSVRELPENLDRIQAVLEEYDRTPSTLRLRFDLIQATSDSVSDPEIAGITDALRDILRFPGYRLEESSVIAVTPGTISRQMLGGGDGEPYRLEVGVTGLWGPADSLMAQMGVWLDGAGGQQLLATQVSIPVGETVVLGSSRAAQDGLPVILAVTLGVDSAP